jgi:L-asparaginase
LFGPDVMLQTCSNNQYLYFYPVFEGWQVDERKILVLGTGGTIAGVGKDAGDHTGYTAGQLAVAQLLEGLPKRQEWQHRLMVEQLAQLDSKDMDAPTWARLARRIADALADPQVQGVVITHGTDTLEETAFFLHAVLAPGKPVVLTCAMRPATALGADGPQNLLDALTLADAPDARGVLTVCAGTIHGAVELQKVHPYRLDAFSSGDAGVIGYVEEGRVRSLRTWPTGQARPELLEHLHQAWPRVAVVMSHALADGWVIDALVQQGARGIVVAATGNATVHLGLLEALQSAQQSGVKVLLTSRCPLGQLLNEDVQGQGAWHYSALSPVKARIALALDLLECGS